MSIEKDIQKSKDKKKIKEDPVKAFKDFEKRARKCIYIIRALYEKSGQDISDQQVEKFASKLMCLDHNKIENANENIKNGNFDSQNVGKILPHIDINSNDL